MKFDQMIEAQKIISGPSMKIDRLFVRDGGQYWVGYFSPTSSMTISEINERADFYEIHYKNSKMISQVNKAFIYQVDLVEVDD